MKYDDLLNIPYKKFGQDTAGYDCFGLVIECCKRNGTPLLLPDYELTDAESLAHYIAEGFNIKPIKTPKIGCIVETMLKGTLHVGFLVEKNLMIHSTPNRGVKTSSLMSVQMYDPNIKFYEVIK